MFVYSILCIPEYEQLALKGALVVTTLQRLINCRTVRFRYNVFLGTKNSIRFRRVITNRKGKTQIMCILLRYNHRPHNVITTGASNHQRLLAKQLTSK